MAPHDWRLVAVFEVSDQSVAEIRDELRSQIAGFMTGGELPKDALEKLTGNFTRFMTPDQLRQTSLHCEACGAEWVPGEAVVPGGGPQAGDECPARGDG